MRLLNKNFKKMVILSCLALQACASVEDKSNTLLQKPEYAAVTFHCTGFDSLTHLSCKPAGLDVSQEEKYRAKTKSTTLSSELSN